MERDARHTTSPVLESSASYRQHEATSRLIARLNESEYVSEPRDCDSRPFQSESLDWTHHSAISSEIGSQCQTDSHWESETRSFVDAVAPASSRASQPFYPPIEEIQLCSPSRYGVTTKHSKDDLLGDLDNSCHSCWQKQPSFSRGIALQNAQTGFALREESEAAPPSVSNVRNLSPGRGLVTSTLIGSVGQSDRYIQTTQPEMHFHRVIIEVSPGIEALLVGAEETTEALKWNHISSCACLICEAGLSCMEDASLVLCPLCYTISPVGCVEPGPSLIVGLGICL